MCPYLHTPSWLVQGQQCVYLRACIYRLYLYLVGYAVAQLVEALRYEPGRSRVRFPMMSLEFFIDIILPAVIWPWGDSASNGNEYQQYFLGGAKASGAYCRQPYHLHVPIVLKSGNLNLLETFGSVQACNGIALSFYLYLVSIAAPWRPTVLFVCVICWLERSDQWNVGAKEEHMKCVNCDAYMYEYIHCCNH